MKKLGDNTEAGAVTLGGFRATVESTRAQSVRSGSVLYGGVRGAAAGGVVSARTMDDRVRGDALPTNPAYSTGVNQQ